MQNLNRWLGTGNLTRDPELRQAGSTTICGMRLACNGRTKNSSTGAWEDKPNYFDVTVFGAQGENCQRYLKKGSSVAIDGRLDWREWTTEGGDKRQAVQIIAESVQFLDGRSDGERPSEFASREETGAAPPPVSPADDDIPF